MNISTKEVFAYLDKASIEKKIIFPSNILEIYTLASLKEIIANGLYYLESDYIDVSGKIDKSLIITNAPSANIPASSSNAFLIVQNPQVLFYELCRLVMPIRKIGIHETAIIEKGAQIGKNVYIGPYAVIGNCVIEPGCYIDAHVVVGDNVIIKNGTVIEPNSYIGAQGVAWVWDERGNRVVQPQFGGVVIEEHCFIGSDVSVVRGSVNESTFIGKGTLIAHGTKIGHGAYLSENCHLANNVSLAGNSRIGARCFLGAACTVSSHIHIADDCIIGAGAVVTKSVSESNVVLAGIPAKILRNNAVKHKLNGVPQKK